MSNKPKLWSGPSNSEKYLLSKSDVPSVSALMSKAVSRERRDGIAEEVNQGLFRDGSSSNNADGETRNGRVVASVGNKYGQVISNSGGNFGGSGDTVHQAPEIYSPLWLNSNANLPRDRATINAWCRSFYALNPFVQNAINLHSTYPISKLNIKCPNKDIERFFNDMIEEIDLMNICVQIAQEYWLLGESFVYAEMDQSRGKWSRLLIQNPDYMIVQRTVVANEPIIMLRPDENLKKVIFSNKSTDIEQRKQLPGYVVDSVKNGGNIPLDNFLVSHLARRISPYEIRGTGLPVCVFRQLMLFDKLRECYSEDTEVLTDKGFKKITDLMYQTSQLELNPNYINGTFLDENGKVQSILTMKEDFKVACYNADTNEVEYHKPLELHLSQYNGKMIHFKNKNIDTLVSPNHKMWASKKSRIKGVTKYKPFEKIKASEIYDPYSYRFQGTTGWVGKDISTVNVLGKEVDIKLYLKFLGYVISEGYLGQNTIDFCQKIDSDCVDDIKQTVIDFAAIFDKEIYQGIHSTKDYKKSGFNKQPSDRWNGRIFSKDLMNYFIGEISDGNAKSYYKYIPAWVKNLNISLLKELLNTLVLGDGSHIKNRSSMSFRYYTTSRQLADDVQEIAFKCGFAPSICTKTLKSGHTEYLISWTDSNYGKNPSINFKEVDYNGVVWCFEVPTGLFVTRRNGQIAIHGNSKYAQADNMINPMTLVKVGTDAADGLHPTFADLEAWRSVFETAQHNKDFKIFTHAGVAVERVGYGQGIYDISGDITQIIKEIYVGLQVPSVLMDGGADTTYANGGVALDVLRQRYMQFRNMMSTWLKRKIFAPISKLQGFYDYSGGEKQLIVPEVDWNHMSLFDAGDYINTLVTLTTGEDGAKRASLHTLYRSLGMEFEDEVRKMRKESIQTAIVAKEKVSLEAMDLNALRALDEEDEIPEIDSGEVKQDAPLPGENSDAGALPGAGLDLSGQSPPPPPPIE